MLFILVFPPDFAPFLLPKLQKRQLFCHLKAVLGLKMPWWALWMTPILQYIENISYWRYLFGDELNGSFLLWNEFWDVCIVVWIALRSFRYITPESEPEPQFHTRLPTHCYNKNIKYGRIEVNYFQNFTQRNKHDTSAVQEGGLWGKMSNLYWIVHWFEMKGHSN